MRMGITVAERRAHPAIDVLGPCAVGLLPDNLTDEAVVRQLGLPSPGKRSNGGPESPVIAATSFTAATTYVAARGGSSAQSALPRNGVSCGTTCL